MSGTSWLDILWMGHMLLGVGLSALLIVAGVLALRGRGRMAGSLLVTGGAMSVIGMLSLFYLNLKLRGIMGPGDEYEKIMPAMQATQGLLSLGRILEAVGVLLLALAYRALWNRSAQIDAIGPGAR